MTTIDSTTIPTKTAPSAADAPTPLTPEQIVEQLRLLQHHVPDYQQLATTDLRSLVPEANVSQAFVQTSINAVGSSPSLQSSLGRTQEELRQETDDAARWTGVEDELRAMLKGVAAANLTRRHRIGQTALHTFGIGRQLARRPEHADLLPHIAELSRLNRASRNRRKRTAAKPPAPATTSPAPQPSPTTPAAATPSVTQTTTPTTPAKV
ncbi:MAG: hypothetical protein JWO56_3096 [Acidobacteria bacterium]|nr:hypothetical protein [Acidobacteriota bacterium]